MSQHTAAADPAASPSGYPCEICQRAPVAGRRESGGREVYLCGECLARDADLSLLYPELYGEEGAGEGRRGRRKRGRG